MYYVDDFNILCDEIINRQNGDKTLFLSFSRGKDAIAAFLRCMESNKFEKYVLYHYYLLPDMSFVNESLQYFKEKFSNLVGKKIDIINVPNPMFYDLLSTGVLQTPLRIKAIEKLNIDEGEEVFVKYTLTDLMNVVKDNLGLPDNTHCAVGVKSSDSMMRRTAIMKHGLISENLKKWYPIHDMTDRDIITKLTKYDVQLPEDYKLFGLTFDGIDYRFLKIIHDKKPEDYKRIKEIFPLIDLMLYKHENYFGTKIKSSKFSKLL